ncbi:MAG: substrate-binding domain-containing protein [Fimbriimonas sp.]|nr:substrate-binding domain-containing protein [Fimbriimonas sp.]
MSKLSTLLLLALSVVLAGCTKEEPATKESSSASGGSASPSTGGGKLKIVFIPKNTGNVYFNPIIDGFKEASGEIGAEFTTIAPATADATSQIPIIKDQIQRGVDVIAIAANSADALNNVLDEARGKGITVITVDSDLVGNETHRDAYIRSPNATEVGQGQVELLGSMTGYEGPFAILSATTDAPNQNTWIACMKDTLKQPKYAKMKLVDTVYGDDQAEKSTTVCEGLLSTHPDLRGIISPTSVGLAAAAQTIKLAGVYPGGPHATGKGIQLTGLSTPNQLKSFVKSGVVTSFQLWNTHDSGYVAAYIGQALHGGKVKPAEGTTVDVGKLGKRTFEKLGIASAGPLVTFDKSNIDKYDF